MGRRGHIAASSFTWPRLSALAAVLVLLWAALLFLAATDAGPAFAAAGTETCTGFDLQTNQVVPVPGCSITVDPISGPGPSYQVSVSGTGFQPGSTVYIGSCFQPVVGGECQDARTEVKSTPCSNSPSLQFCYADSDEVAVQVDPTGSFGPATLTVKSPIRDYRGDLNPCGGSTACYVSARGPGAESSVSGRVAIEFTEPSTTSTSGPGASMPSSSRPAIAFTGQDHAVLVAMAALLVSTGLCLLLVSSRPGREH